MTVPKSASPTSQNELRVVMVRRRTNCVKCCRRIRGGTRMLPRGERGVCLKCLGLDHLVFLASGDTAMTRRARKYSTVAVVAMKWQKLRRRLERHGLLVEKDALDRATEECRADSVERGRRRKRERKRRDRIDAVYATQFAARIREVFPGCPEGREFQIAERACQKYSGRIGRTASAKQLSMQAVRLAVVAHIRHKETEYDRLLSAGKSREEARVAITRRLTEVMRQWKAGPD